MRSLRRQMAIIILATAIASVAQAQTPDVAGEWRITRPSGSYDVVLRQQGNNVTGTYHLGQLQGTLNGTVLTGNYSDIMTSGGIQFTFSADGTQFRGLARGSEPWNGVRLTTSTASAADVLSMRARLPELQQAGASFEKQLVEGCKNLFGATYSSLGGGETWVTSYSVGPNAFTPVLGAQTGTQYIEIRGIEMTNAQAARLSEADIANGRQYVGIVQFKARLARTGSQAGWALWQNANKSVFGCRLEVTNGNARLVANDQILGIDAARLAPPQSLPPG